MKQTKYYILGVLLFFFVFPTISSANNVTDGLVGYWQFKNSLVNVQSGGQGSLMNGANFTSGKLDQGLNFDGVDDYFQPASNSSLNNLNSITITAWINERSMGGNGLARGRIIEKGNGAVRRFVLLAGDEDNLQFNAGYGATTAATFKTPPNSLSKNAWHHVAVTYTFGNPANIPDLYINGVKQQAIPNDIASGSPVADDDTVFIGGGRRSWDGLIDEVRIYNRILTSSEINAVYAYENPPNIVVIMSDDQEASSLSIMGNVKRFLSDQGVRFINSFVNYPLCCPSRASFLTGQAAHNTGIVGNSPGEGGGYEPFMRQEGNTLPVWLQGAGYHTAVIGKYLNSYGDGVTSSTTRIPPGWDTVNLLPDSLGTYYYYNYSININGTLESYGASSADYQTDVLAQKAANYIRSRQNSAQPFFLWLTPMAPHDSLAQNDEDPFSLNAATPPLRYLGSYDNIPLPILPNFNEADVSDKPLFVQNRPLFNSSATAMTTNNWRRKQETILGVDDMVARVVSELQNTGKLNNTVIIYTSDNGWANGQHRRVTGKRNVYEEIIQVPLVMRGPGVPAGQIRTQLVNNLDLVATIEDLAHAAPGRTPDGSSLLPIISNQNTPWRTGLLVEGTDGNNPWQTFINGKEYWPGTLGRFFAVRTPNYVYVEHTTPDIGFEREFYDLSKDPYQLESRPNDLVYASVVNGLQSILSNLKSCVGASCFVTSPVPTLTVTPPPVTTITPNSSPSPYVSPYVNSSPMSVPPSLPSVNLSPMPVAPAVTAPKIPKLKSTIANTTFGTVKFGTYGSDNLLMQKVFNEDSYTKIASSGPGSPGLETTYYGVLTRRAVIKFQEKYASEVLIPLGLTKGTGYVGPATKKKLREVAKQQGW